MGLRLLDGVRNFSVYFSAVFSITSFTFSGLQSRDSDARGLFASGKTVAGKEYVATTMQTSSLHFDRCFLEHECVLLMKCRTSSGSRLLAQERLTSSLISRRSIPYVHVSPSTPGFLTRHGLLTDVVRIVLAYYMAAPSPLWVCSPLPSLSPARSDVVGQWT